MKKIKVNFPGEKMSYSAIKYLSILKKYDIISASVE